jgi:protocatechuate 3,4-dioxygenase beta subunit
MCGRAALVSVAGCGDNARVQPDAAAAPDAETCTAFPFEIPGPFPGDGTNGPNALALAGIVRSDIRASIAGATGVAAGVPLVLTLTLERTTCEPASGLAVYLWQCDRDGNYSMYATPVVDENYLRGVQVTDDAGRVTFTTVFPGCYPGRWPHLHIEVYASAATVAPPLLTSQLALPASACNDVYATADYKASAAAFAQVSLANDVSFGDDLAVTETPAISGDVVTGLSGTLKVVIV